MGPLGSRIIVAAFDGWNDAGEAATNAISQLRALGDYEIVHTVDPELYFDYQYTRPTVANAASGRRELRWPEASLLRPAADHPEQRIWLLTGAEPARAWKAFANEMVDAALAEDITGLVTFGAMLSDVPHTRPISIYASSANDEIRAQLELEKSLYEGPVGMISVLSHFAEEAGIPSASLWASLPHYVGATAPSPKATLALVDRFIEITGIEIPRETLVSEAATWEASIDAAAADDEDMADYIRELERARDAWDSPDASGDAIAQAFETYLRKRGEPPTDPRR